MISLREFQDIKPIECKYGHMANSDGYLLLLDTLDAAKGFCVGNTIYVCTRHLGGRNTALPCSNTIQMESAKSLRQKVKFKTLIKRKVIHSIDSNT